LLSALVKRDDLQQANALQQTSSAAAGVAGPAVAGVFVATIGAGWAIVADAGTLFVSVVMLSLIQFRHVPRARPENWVRDLRDGWQDFWARDWFRDLVIGASVFNLLYAVYLVLGPVMSRRYYGGVGAWASTATAAAIGSVLAGLVATRLRPRYPLRLAVPLSGLFFLTPLAFAALLPVPVIAASAAIGGGMLVIFTTLWLTSVQQHVPDQMLSRATSYDWFASLITYPVGLAIAGPLAAAAGPRRVLLAVGVLLIIETCLLTAVPSIRNLSNAIPAAAADASGASGASGAFGAPAPVRDPDQLG